MGCVDENQNTSLNFDDNVLLQLDVGRHSQTSVCNRELTAAVNTDDDNVSQTSVGNRELTVTRNDGVAHTWTKGSTGVKTSFFSHGNGGTFRDKLDFWKSRSSNTPREKISTVLLYSKLDPDVRKHVTLQQLEN